jgi:hypothetical protein
METYIVCPELTKALGFEIGLEDVAASVANK